MKRNSLTEIAEVLKGGSYITLYPHENMDGDALGSTVALAKALRTLGKEAWIYYVDEIPDNLVFLDKGYVTNDRDKASKADIANDKVSVTKTTSVTTDGATVYDKGYSVVIKEGADFCK